MTAENPTVNLIASQDNKNTGSTTHLSSFSYTSVSIIINTMPEQFQIAQNDLHIQRQRRDVPRGTRILSTYCAIFKGL